MTSDDRVRAVLAHVATLRTRPCLMAHERARHDSQGKLERRHIGAGQTAIVRVGLCPWREREMSLACAHTTAHVTLANALDTLHRSGIISDAQHVEFQCELTEIATSIHRLDWDRGDTEKALAVALEAIGEAGDDMEGAFVEQLRRRIVDHEHAHADYTKRIATLLELVRRQIPNALRAT